MRNLEHVLAEILKLIEHARTEKDASALDTLLQRKEWICAALAAPEHAWHHPSELAPSPIVQREATETVAMSLVA
jgi:hypothetical protein